MVDDIRAYLDGLSETHRSIVERARELITEIHPDVSETIKWDQPVFELDGEDQFYLAAQSDHVNLGFMKGADMTDPDGLLEGTGKRMRHIKVRNSADLESPEIRALVERSIEY